MTHSKMSVSSQTISSATLSAKGAMRCNRSKKAGGVWSRLLCSLKSYMVKRYLCFFYAAVGTNLNRNFGNTEDSLSDVIHLKGVGIHVLPVPIQVN